MLYVNEAIKNLERHNMKGYYVRNKDELHSLIKTFITPGEKVGCGDSITLEETGVFEMLRKGDYDFLDKHRKGLTGEEKREIYLQNFRCDTFVTGVNAVTADGKLFNIDGNGSRVAPMLYGPKQVIAVAGSNKLVENTEEAVQRARQTAAPMDAKRLNKNTPCAKMGKCIDCNHKDRICNDFVLITRQFIEGRIKVIIIDGSYGY